ncbi:MAG: hypothetical protein AB7V34_04795 [Brachymonas sp.]
MYALLHIGPDSTTLDFTDASAADATTPSVVARLPLGLTALQQQMRHAPLPTAGEVEACIAEVEDILMPRIAGWPRTGLLRSHDAEARHLAEAAAAAGHPAQPLPLTLSIDAVEEVFNRLADVLGGMPAARLGIPERPEFIAYLIVLRELMHHAGFVSLRVCA